MSLFNTTISNSTNSTYPWSTDHCNPILLQLATNESIYQTIPLGLCPDVISTPIYSSVLLITQLVLAFGTIIFVCIRRNHEPIKSRSAFLISLSNILLSIVSTVLLLRFIIGRAIYPCSVYTLLFFTVYSFVVMPFAMRLYRLFILMKTNELKLKYSKMERDSLGKSITTLDQLHHEIGKIDNQVSTVPVEGQTAQITSNEIVPSNNPVSHSTTVAPDAQPPTNDTPIYFSHAKHIALKRQISILKFLISPPALLLPIATSLLLCVLFWFFITSLELIIPKPIIVDRGFAMNIGVGCSLSLTGVVIVGIIGLLHIVVIFFVCIINCKTKDTLFIKYEIVLMLLVYAIPVAMYLILGLIPFVYELTDYFIPYGTVLITVPLLESIVSGCLPACISLKPKDSDRLKNKSRQSVETKLDGIRVALEHPKIREQFLNYAQRSFCPEFVLCWQEINKYQQSKMKRKRMEIFEHIVKTFLENNAPLELNLPQETRMEYIKCLSEETQRMLQNRKVLHLDKLADDMALTNKLNELKGKCEFNLIDLFKRFKEVPFAKKLLQSINDKPVQ